MDAHWNAKRDKKGDLKYVTLVTIGGGDKDMQVRMIVHVFMNYVSRKMVLDSKIVTLLIQ